MSSSIPPNDATKIQRKFDTRKFLIKKYVKFLTQALIANPIYKTKKSQTISGDKQK